MDVIVYPSKIRGVITAPPSKSYAHRYLIAAFLAGEKCRIFSAGNSDDVTATLKALESAGLIYERDEKTGVITVFGKRDVNSPTVYCKESGSTLRFLIPVFNALGLNPTFCGEKGLLSRPQKPLIDCLLPHGIEENGLSFNGKLCGGDFYIDPSVSSQYVSGLLFALPVLKEDSRIIFTAPPVSKKYIDITLDVIKKFSVKIEKTANGYKVKGGQKYVSPKRITVEGDYSSAAFPLVAGAIGGEVTVKGIKKTSRQGDKKIIDVLARAGADITVKRGEVTVKAAPLKGITANIDEIPDLAQIIAVLGAFSKGETRLNNVGRLKIKESDRVLAIENTLAAANIKTARDGDNLIVTGGNPTGGKFDGGKDHRTAMSAFVTAACAQGKSLILGIDAADKSYPEFLSDMKNLGVKFKIVPADK